MRIRRAKATDEEALASIRRNAILVLAVSAMSKEQPNNGLRERQQIALCGRFGTILCGWPWKGP